MSKELANTQATGYANLISTNETLKEVKLFEGLFTEIAVSANGYIAIYHPYEPAKKGLLKGSAPEQQEWLEVWHISQINDFDIDVDGTETTKVKGGAGGAIVGGLLGGAVGSVIGSAATSGKVKTKTKINSVDLVLSTTDFNNPQVRVRLSNGYFSSQIMPIAIPPALKQHMNSMGLFTAEGKRLYKDKYNNGEINMPTIEALQSTLSQMLAAQQRSEASAAAAPQLSAADELAKFKGLLDSGVITQDEFDAKKRQLLGL